MPIGDLLSSITGEKAQTPPAPPQGVKRRATEDAGRNSVPSKLQRTGSLTNGSANGSANPTNGSRPARPTEKPMLSGARPSPASARPVDKPASSPLVKRPIMTPTSSKPFLKKPAPPTAAAPAAKPASSAPPKKGTFKEIMARGLSMQKTMANMTKLEHKSTGKLPTKRERMEAAAEQAKAAKKLPPGKSAPAPSRPGMNGARNGAASLAPKPGEKKTAPANSKRPTSAEPEKKIKKAALATTGYTGTARPRPTAPGKPTGGAPNHRTGGLLRGPQRPRDRRSRLEEEYDDEMDDFIDDDEDEDDVPRGYRYQEDMEDDESDMEAGLDEVDEEERRAEMLARREDALEEARLQKLAREKEARKRALASRR